LLFIVNVDFGETFADVRERSKVRSERNARQFAFQVRRVALAILRMMQQGVDVLNHYALKVHRLRWD
jgi:hypothetical protein